MAFCMDRIRRGSAAALVALGLAACDSNMPETFNAEATSGDVNAMTGIFAAPVFESFAAASGDVDEVTGTGASASIAQLRSGADGRQVDAARYAARSCRPGLPRAASALRPRTSRPTRWARPTSTTLGLTLTSPPTSPARRPTASASCSTRWTR
jgi:hypothetical protein